MSNSTSVRLMGRCVANSGRWSGHDASDVDFRSNSHGYHFGDNRLVAPSCRKSVSDDGRRPSHTIENVGRGSDRDPTVGRVIENSRKSGVMVCRGVYRGICDRSRACLWKSLLASPSERMTKVAEDRNHLHFRNAFHRCEHW